MVCSFFFVFNRNMIFKTTTIADKCQEWKNFLSNPQQDEIQAPDTILYIYYFAFFMKELLDTVLNTIKNKKTIVDVRYLDQLYDFENNVFNFHEKCGIVLSFYSEKIKTLGEYKLECQKSKYYHWCQKYKDEKIHNTTVCSFFFIELKHQLKMIMTHLFTSMISNFYYLHKLYLQKRLEFPFPIYNIPNIQLGNIHLWEVVCEDEETQYLCHQNLSHPNDFLIKHKNKKTHSYLHVAKFEYEIPNTLKNYVVVLSKKPSLIPKLSYQYYQEEPFVSIKHKKQEQTLYLESTRHCHYHNKKKRSFSRIKKETRKKKKTKQLYQRRLKEHYHTDYYQEQYDISLDEDDDNDECLSYISYDDDYDYDYDYPYFGSYYEY